MDIMDEMFSVLMTIDFPEGVTSGLRHNTDAMRGVLERTRGDLTMALRQHSLEARCRFGVARLGRDHAGQLVVDIVAEIAAQALQADPASTQHGYGIGILDQGKQQMFEGRVFMAPLVGVGESAMQCLFEVI
jgi:hypothetical protein